jgi:hypothetical protein
MRNLFIIGLFSALLSGCAMLPVPVQMASWALDGLSVIATQKSLTDHGLSLVSKQDCALWRGLTEGEVCRDNAIQVEVLTAASNPGAWDDSGLGIPLPTTELDRSSNQPVISELYLNVI